MRKKIIIYLYNGLNDPLIKGNIMLYVMEAAKSGKYEFYIVTYEQDQFLLENTEENEKRKELESLGIHWKAFKWSSGSAIKKGLDFLRAAGFIFFLRFFKGYRSIISLATVAGAFAYMYSSLFFMRLYLYQYEPHSEYGLDAGMWTREDWVFKILNTLERKSAQKAKVISSGTYHMMNRLEDWGVKAECIKIPSVVDHERFVFSEKARQRIRDHHGIEEDQRVIIYPGKFGDLYYEDEIGKLFASMLSVSPNYFFIILTLTDQGIARRVMETNGIPASKYFIGTADYSEMSDYLSASDLGVVAVPPLPSKKFCSNIKVGEYLCNGLPYLICKGVSEDDEFAIEQNVGIVITQFDGSFGQNIHDRLNSLYDVPRRELNERCRASGMKYRSFRELNPRFQGALENL